MSFIQNSKCPTNALQMKLIHVIDLTLMNVFSHVNFNIR